MQKITYSYTFHYNYLHRFHISFEDTDTYVNVEVKQPHYRSGQVMWIPEC